VAESVQRKQMGSSKLKGFITKAAKCKRMGDKPDTGREDKGIKAKVYTLWQEEAKSAL